MASAATLSALVTALWVNHAAAHQPATSRGSSGGPRLTQPAAADPPADCRQQIWARTWQPFEQQPQQPPHSASAAGGRRQQQQHSQVQPPANGPACQQRGGSDRPPQPTRLLLLEGLRAAERSQLLAVCLAALEEQVAALPPDLGLLGAQQWSQLTLGLLACTSAAAARAWLGYLPPDLESACLAELQSVDAELLRRAGMAPGGGSRALAVAGEGLVPGGASGRSSSPSGAGGPGRGSSSGGDGGGGSQAAGHAEGAAAAAAAPPPAAVAAPGTADCWFGLEEKLPLYCSVRACCSPSRAAQRRQRQERCPARARQGRQQALHSCARCQSPLLCPQAAAPLLRSTAASSGNLQAAALRPRAPPTNSSDNSSSSSSSGNKGLGGPGLSRHCAAGLHGG